MTLVFHHFGIRFRSTVATQIGFPSVVSLFASRIGSFFDVRFDILKDANALIVDLSLFFLLSAV